MHIGLRRLAVAGITAVILSCGLAATTASAATVKPAPVSSAISAKSLGALVADHKLIEVPLSELKHGTVLVSPGQVAAMHTARSVMSPDVAPTCMGFGCTGLDPVNQSNCSVGGYPVTGYTKTISGLGTIRLMYQNSCQANWGEADNASTSAWITAYAVVNGILYEIPPYNLSPYNYGWTSMVDGQVSAAACIGFAGQLPYCVVQSGLPSEPPVWVS
jgi:hypothetical protein